MADDQHRYLAIAHLGGPESTTDPPGWVDRAPTSGADQSCALCRSQVVTWVHPLAAERVRYRVFGNGYTLPTFWTLCDRCEGLYAAGDDDAIVEIMKASDGWYWSTEADVAEMICQPLVVFRSADKGARRHLD